MGEGTANIAYELGPLHLAPPRQFIGGAVQSYYEQGYNKLSISTTGGRLETGGALVILPFSPFI
jgi:hypothetical protein